MTFSTSDKDAMLKELARDDTTVEIDPEKPWNVNGRMPIGEGTTLIGNGATMIATGGSRLWIEQPGVTVQNLRGYGYFTLYAYTGGLTVEDVMIRHTLPGSDEYLDLAATGGATAAFMVWGAGGKTLRDIAMRRCFADRTYHHGFSLNLSNANEGGGFANVLYEGCKSYGAGAVACRNKTNIWACAFDVPDAGDVDGLTIRDFEIHDPVQDGVHLDGSWEGHRQYQRNVLVENGTITRAGTRCPAESVEKFRSGVYMQNGTIRNVHTEACAGAGFALKNQESTMLRVEQCSDTGSQYGMICEYGAPNAVIEFTSKAATRRAFLGQVGGSGTLDLTIIDPPETAVTLGRTIRSDYIDCPNHAADRDTGKYAVVGYAVNGFNIIIRSPQKPVVEIWKASRLNGAITYIIEDAEPVTDPVVDPPIIDPVIPVPVPQTPTLREYLLREDLALNLYDGNGVRRWTMFPPDDIRPLLPPGTKYVPGGSG